MNLFQIILKNMRQRALGTWLTLLSVTLGVALAIAVLIVYREGRSLFGQTEFGYDVIVGPNRSSPMQLVMNTVYHIDQSAGTVPYATYERLLRDRQYRRNVKAAVPVAVGDSVQNRRVIATLPKMFGFEPDGTTPLPTDYVIGYARDARYELAEGRCFHAEKFEAVVGWEAGAEAGLRVGDRFRVTHGTPGPGEAPDEHAEEWTVVGRLAKTGTAGDRVVYIPLVSFYCIPEHEEGLSAQAMIRAGIDPTQMPQPPAAPVEPAQADPASVPTTPSATPTTSPATAEAAHDDHDDHAGHDHGDAYHMNADGTIDLHLPKDEWALSAILVKARGGDAAGFRANELLYLFRVRSDALAVSPAGVMREFFDTFLKGTTLVLLLISALVTVVAAVGILVSIYNSVAARKREIAVLRALGATRSTILTLICLEAALIGLVGGLLGLVVGHAMGAVGSGWLNAFIGQGIAWQRVDRWEVLYLAGVTALATLAGLVPAAAAYRTPVATNLVPE